MPFRRSGFTLVEMMIVLAVLAVLVSIAIPRYANLMLKSQEGATKGNLGSLRSALSVYFGDNEQSFPSDNLGSLTAGSKYIPNIPLLKTPNFHLDSTSVITEASPTDSGQWSYNNDSTSAGWGLLYVGCLHHDTAGNIWTQY